MSAPVTFELDPFMKAVLTLAHDVTGAWIGDGEAPKPDDDEVWTDFPYAIAYGGPVRLKAEGMDDWHTDAAVPVQFTCVAQRGDQARILADDLAKAFLDSDGADYVNPLVSPDVVCIDREYASATGPTPEGELWYMILGLTFEVVAEHG